MCNLTTDELYSLLNEMKIEQARMGEQLNNQQKLLEGVQNIALAVRDLANAQSNTSEQVRQLRSDVDDIQKKPEKKLDMMQTVVITAVLSGVIGFAIKAIFG